MLLRATSFLFTLLYPLALAEQSYSQTAEIDLIFPLNDTYRPIHPFPIVFALRNPAAIWPFNFMFYYTLEVYNKEEDRFMIGQIGGMEDYGHWPYSTNTIDIENTPHEDPLLIINATKIMTGINDTYGYITWDIGLTYNCTEDLDADEEVPSARHFQDRLYFSISNNGSMPDFSAFSPCPTLVGALGIDGETLPRGAPHDLGNCAVLSEKQPKGDQCGLKMNDNIATRVADTMKDFIGCEEGEWPNPTATTCAEMSGSGSRRPSLGWVGALGLAAAYISALI